MISLQSQCLRGWIGPVATWTCAVVIALAAACRRDASAFNQTVVCDRSSSGGEIACGRDVLRRGTAQWYDEVRSRGAGHLDVVVIGRGIDDAPVVFTREYPRRFAAPVSRSQAVWRDSLSVAVDSLAAALPVNRGSAVVEAVFRAAHRLEGGAGTVNRLVLASDLRQVTAGVWNFEREVPEYEVFRTWVEENRLTPGYGVLSEIMVCGFHLSNPGNTSRMTAANYRRLEDLWSRLLARWAARTTIREECAAVWR